MVDEPEVPSTLKDWAVPEGVSPLLGYIKQRESGGKYNIMQGNRETFDVNGPHPGQGQYGKSSANGAYAFTKPTWEGVAGKDTPMLPEYQDRAAYKNAATIYYNKTGRDLAADMQEKGLTPEIASHVDAGWLGVKSLNGQVLGNLPGGKRIGIVDALKMNNASDDTIAANMPQGSQGKGSSSGNQQASGDEGYARLLERNIPYKQSPEKVGLLGMLGVSTTENERLAMIKMGARMMQTPGSFGTALGAGLEQYADTLQAANKQTADIANTQTEGKLKDAQARKAISESVKYISDSSQGVITGMPNATGGVDIATTPVANPNEKNRIGGTGPGGVGPGGAGSPGSAESPGGTFKPQKTEEIAKNNPNIASVYADDEKGANERFGILEKLRNNDPSVKPAFKDFHYNEAEWRKRFNEEKEEANRASKGARDGTTALSMYAGALANTPKDGFLTTGAGAEKRYAVGNAIDTALRGFGVTDDMIIKAGYDPAKIKQISDARTAQIELGKLGVQLAKQQNPSGTVAARWLEQTVNSLPSVENTPAANAALLGALYAARKQAMDNYNTIEKIGGVTNQTGYGKTSQFLQEINPSKNYARDAKMVAELVNPENAARYGIEVKNKDGKIERHNIISALSQGLIDDDKVDAFLLKEFKVHNGSRMFK
jgi:muramidase (phage lysozyme)